MVHELGSNFQEDNPLQIFQPNKRLAAQLKQFQAKNCFSVASSIRDGSDQS